MNANLEAAIQEAMSELDRQMTEEQKVSPTTSAVTETCHSSQGLPSERTKPLKHVQHKVKCQIGIKSNPHVTKKCKTELSKKFKK